MDQPPRREAIALLYERHYGELVRLAFALTSDWALAEDLAQEAFARAWRGWGNIRDQQRAPAYLRATVVNLARTSVRRMLRETGDPGAADLAVSIDLLRALSRLPARKRACVVLRYYLDLSEADTAAALGVSVGTVRARRRKLCSGCSGCSATLAPSRCPGPSTIKGVRNERRSDRRKASAGPGAGGGGA
jgi:RNA polymerase sigma factor (sigma-70 family)